MASFLIIQTASIGDVILSTPLIEGISATDTAHSIDFLLKKGCEGLFTGHPLLNEVLVWDKSQGKYSALAALMKKIRRRHYDVVINAQRFASTGLITAFSRAAVRSGFNKNPLSVFYTHRHPHKFGDNTLHESERNLSLLKGILPTNEARIKLYPGEGDFQSVASYKGRDYISISPASLWFTKQHLPEKWAELMAALPGHYHVYLLGSTSDVALCNHIGELSGNSNFTVLAGKLSLLQTAALMQDSLMNFTNDSAPMHLASAVNAAVTAVFCSTVPGFGFGPRSQRSFIAETPEELTCRPCGIHGRKNCPEHHFNCSKTITKEQLLLCLNS